MQPSAAYFLVPVGIGFAVFMLYALLESVKGKVILGQGRIIQIEALGKKELLAEDIKGYTADDTYIRVFPKDPKGPKLKISQYIADNQEILQWVAFHGPNLDLVTFQEEEKQLLSDQTLGLTEQEREATLTQARKVAFWLNGIGYAIMAWLVFYPEPYRWAVLAGAVYPLVLTLVSFKYKGIFRLNTKNNSAHPSITPGLLAAGIGIALRALMDVELLRFADILPWVAGVAAFTFAFLLSTTNEFKYTKLKDATIAALIFLLLSFYGYGVSVEANFLLDNSAPQEFEAQVTDKHISNGKTTTYYLTLAPWGPRKEAEDITVTEEYYEQIPAGETIPVLLYSGALDVPYLVVE